MPRPGLSPPAPFIAPMSGDIDQKLQAMAGAINKKADITSVPTYAHIHLIAPNGAVWMLSVDDTGALSTMVMPR